MKIIIIIFWITLCLVGKTVVAIYCSDVLVVLPSEVNIVNMKSLKSKESKIGPDLLEVTLYWSFAPG